MTQACLKCLKFTMCVANLLCFICGISVLGLGIYMSVTLKMAAIIHSSSSLNLAHVLIITGIIITCVSFLGFLGALKENRCLLITFFFLLFLLMLVELTVACLLLLHESEISTWVAKDLQANLKKAKVDSEVITEWDLVQGPLKCCGVVNASDWSDQVPESCCDGTCNADRSNYYQQGCLETLRVLFEENFLYTGIAVIVLCIFEVLGMCFAMTLYCHISRTGLGYKL